MGRELDDFYQLQEFFVQCQRSVDHPKDTQHGQQLLDHARAAAAPMQQLPSSPPPPRPFHHHRPVMLPSGPAATASPVVITPPISPRVGPLDVSPARPLRKEDQDTVCMAQATAMAIQAAITKQEQQQRHQPS